MRKVLEHIEVRDDGGDERLHCGECGHDLGPATGSYRDAAVHFDESPAASQGPTPVEFDLSLALRHYCCPSCGTLFEVEVRPVEEPG